MIKPLIEFVPTSERSVTIKHEIERSRPLLRVLQVVTNKDLSSEEYQYLNTFERGTLYRFLIPISIVIIVGGIAVTNLLFNVGIPKWLWVLPPLVGGALIFLNESRMVHLRRDWLIDLGVLWLRNPEDPIPWVEAQANAILEAREDARREGLTLTKAAEKAVEWFEVEASGKLTIDNQRKFLRKMLSVYPRSLSAFTIHNFVIRSVGSDEMYWMRDDLVDVLFSMMRETDEGLVANIASCLAVLIILGGQSSALRGIKEFRNESESHIVLETLVSVFPDLKEYLQFPGVHL